MGGELLHNGRRCSEAFSHASDVAGTDETEEPGPAQCIEGGAGEEGVAINLGGPWGHDVCYHRVEGDQIGGAGVDWGIDSGGRHDFLLS